MKMHLEHTDYKTLLDRQKENYNFQKVSWILARYGYSTVRLTDDAQGADFIAQHSSGRFFYKIQLKGRITFRKAYQGKQLWIAFPKDDFFYIFPHDILLDKFLGTGRVMHKSKSWDIDGGYSFGHIANWMNEHLEEYKIQV